MVRLGLLTAGLIGLVVILNISVPELTAVKYESEAYGSSTSAQATDTVAEVRKTVAPIDNRQVIVHQPLPKYVRAAYMTACVAGTPSFRQKLVKLSKETEINSFIIDVKDYSGTISFKPSSAEWMPEWQSANCGARDMKEFIRMLHDNGLYVIARITVFQDPFYAPKRPDLAVQKRNGSVWHDYKGLAFIDVGAQEYWDRIIELSKESYNIGFDELNYDYMRYPSDGPMKDIVFPSSMAGKYGSDKQANLEAFFKYLNEKLDDEKLFADFRHENTGRASTTPYTSVDLFGMTTTNFDDLSIGQVQDRAAPYFDFIAPMVYPSHYPNSFLGLGNPNNYPYKVVNYAMSKGVERMTSSTTPMQGFLHTKIMKSVVTSITSSSTSTTTQPKPTAVFTGLYKKPVYTANKFRTWIQDFDYGGDYDANDVRAEIQASYDAGVMSWMLWAPSNIYTKGALKPASNNQADSPNSTTTN